MLPNRSRRAFGVVGRSGSTLKREKCVASRDVWTSTGLTGAWKNSTFLERREVEGRRSARFGRSRAAIGCGRNRPWSTYFGPSQNSELERRVFVHGRL